jgi:hypothetical protein
MTVRQLYLRGEGLLTDGGVDDVAELVDAPPLAPSRGRSFRGGGVPVVPDDVVAEFTGGVAAYPSPGRFFCGFVASGSALEKCGLTGTFGASIRCRGRFSGVVPPAVPP